MKKIVMVLVVLIVITITCSYSFGITPAMANLKTRSGMLAEISRLQKELDETKAELEKTKNDLVLITNAYNTNLKYLHDERLSGFLSTTSWCSGAPNNGWNGPDNGLTISPNFATWASPNYPGYAKTSDPYQITLIVPENFYAIIKGWKNGVKTYELITKPNTYNFELEGLVIIFPSERVTYTYQAFKPNVVFSIEARQYYFVPVPTGIIN